MHDIFHHAHSPDCRLLIAIKVPDHGANHGLHAEMCAYEAFVDHGDAIGVRPVEALSGLGPVGVDGLVQSFGFLVTLVTAAVFGTVPLLAAVRTDLQVILKDGSMHAGAGPAGSRLRGGLVVLQVAMALTLLVAVGLSGEAFLRLVTHDPGFDASGVLTASIEPPANTYAAPERSGLYRELAERLGRLPDVEAAGLIINLGDTTLIRANAGPESKLLYPYSKCA